MSSYNLLGSSCYGGLFNCGNCPSCSNVGSRNEFVYDPNPYSYNETPNFFNQPPQHQYETYSCEFCGGNSHPGFDCQTGNTPVFDQGPCYNQDFGFNQPPHYSPSQPQTYSCELCGNDAHYGYDCPPQVPFISNPDPCYNQDFDNFPQTSPNFQQQNLCCENCGGPHETFQCQPLNQNFYEPNHCYNSNSFGFDQSQPPQFPVIHQPPQATSTEMLQARENLMNAIQAFLKEYDHIPPKEKCMALALAEERFLKLKQILEEGLNQPEKIQELMLKLLNDLKILNGIQLKKEEHAAKICTPYWKPPIFYDDDDDDDEESSVPLKDIISKLPLSIAITPEFSIMDSLIMKDEHLDTIPEMESDEENESSVEDLNLTPSEFEDLSDIESKCDMPVCDDFMTFSNHIFDSNNDFTSSDDESLSDEDVPEENFKIYSNPLFDEEIISTKIDSHHLNAESDLIESLLNRDTSIVSSFKFDSFLEEFSSELAHIDLISLEIDEADFDPEEEIRLVEKLLYDNSFPRPSEKLNSKNSDAVIESFSPSPISVEDSDSLMEEIDIFLSLDDSIPPGIENDNYDSEWDILFLEELIRNDSLSLPENKSFHFDRYYDPSSPRPPAKPPDDDGIHFDIDPDTGILTAKEVDDISEHYVLMPSILPTHPTHCPVIDTLLPFSSENENKVFNSSILASNEDKSHHLLSHRGFKAFQIISDFSESPIMIYGRESLILDVPFLHFYPL
ncbi:hypothetical protein Tco_0712225 [Tanacetum coccineum]